MKTVIIAYDVISPAVLACKIEKAFTCLCHWRDIDEHFYELIVVGVCADAMGDLEDVLAEFV